MSRELDLNLVMPPVLPASLNDFVVPPLQQRGIFRRDYTGTTLREHYRLVRPESQYFASTSRPEGAAA